ncbi:hypothetical protein AOLI_G00188020 [Acnodon oligacanthus]
MAVEYGTRSPTRLGHLPSRRSLARTRRGVSHERSTSRHPPRVPPWHNQRTENGQEGCSSKALRKQERAPHAPPRSASKGGPGPGRALKPSLPFTLMLRLKPAPPFTLMLRLGRSQGSCQDGPRNSYLPGRGDTMITKGVSHERSTSRHPPRVPPWHNQRTENGQEGCSSKALRKQERAPHAPPRSASKGGPGPGPGRALKPSLPFTLMLRLKPAPPFTLMLRLGLSQGSCQDGPRNSYLPGRGDTMITKGVSHERSTSRHPPRVPPWHNQRTENGQEGCSSKALRKQERAPHAPPRSASKGGPGPGRALKPSLPFTLMLRLKPAPPFTLMLRLGRSQGSCQDGPRNSYLPGRGDTMITKVVHPGRGSAIALGWC